MIWVVLVLAVVVVVAVCGAAVGLMRRDRRQTAAELARTRAEAAELRAKIEALALQTARPVAAPEEFVITTLGHEIDETPEVVEPVQRIDGRLFVDIVARETVVKAAALTHGVRRALAPEVRNRIRFEMKREIKRSRKARKDEYRRVRDEIRARERAAQGRSQQVPG